MKKVFFSFFALLLALLFCIPAAASESAVGTPAFALSGRAVCLYNLNTDQILYEKNADKQMDMTGLSQIMTALVTLDRTKDIDKEKVKARSILYDRLFGKGYPTADVRQGEILSVRELLYCMMVQNSYEAAEILGDYISEGSEAYFAEMMNKKAEELGMKHTRFTNASGREDTGQYSTAKDLLILIRAAMKQPVIAEMAAAVQHIVPANNRHDESRILIASNRLINPNAVTYYCPGATGLKAVGTESTGRCGLFTATREGLTYYCVVLGAPVYDKKDEYIPTNGAITDAKKLFNWAFSNYSYKNLVNVDSPCAQVKVELSSDTDFVLLYPKESYSHLVPAEVDETSVYLRAVVPDHVDAPVRKGQEIGYSEILLNGTVIGKIPLMAGSDVRRSQILFLGRLASDIFLSPWAIAVYVLLGLLLIAYIVLAVVQNVNRKKHPTLNRATSADKHSAALRHRSRLRTPKKRKRFK